jgi:hypothetical protein
MKGKLRRSHTATNKGIRGISAKTMLIAALSLFGLQSYAQNAEQHASVAAPELKGAPANTTYGDRSVVSGHFDITIHNQAMNNRQEQINVNYVMSPAPFTDKLNLTLNTPDPVKFRAEVVNAQNKVVTHWGAEQRSHLHETTIDISKLPAGQYRVNVYWEKSEDLLYSIPFEKTKQTKRRK